VKARLRAEEADSVPATGSGAAPKPAASDASYFSRQVATTRRFYYPDWRRRSQEEGMELVAGGCEWCLPSFFVERSGFPFLAVEMVWRGRGRVTLDGRVHAVGPGNVYVFDPSVAHRIESDSEEPLVKFFFNFHGPRARDLLDSLGAAPGLMWLVNDPARVAALMEEVVDHALAGSALADHAAEEAARHALTLCRLLRSRNESPDPAWATFQRCRDHLVRGYPRLTSVRHAAAECGVTPAYLCRLFRRFANETPHQCLHRLRMTQALLLIREQRMQVKAVAHDLGFKSPAHFSRSFSAWHGFPPAHALR
jgi:AraC-like DNA-binding protein